MVFFSLGDRGRVVKILTIGSKRELEDALINGLQIILVLLVIQLKILKKPETVLKVKWSFLKLVDKIVIRNCWTEMLARSLGHIIILVHFRSKR
jgi:hypothetical protein